MRRRQVLRSGGVFAVGGLAAALGLEASSDAASAQASTALTVAGDDVRVDAGGSIAAVTLSLDVEWAYDLPESAQPATVVVEVAAGTDGVSVLASAESAQLFASAEGDESFDVGLIEQGVLTADGLTPDSGEQATDVTVEARFRVLNDGGTPLATDTATDVATLTVDKQAIDAAQYGTVEGSGALTIELA